MKTEGLYMLLLFSLATIKSHAQDIYLISIHSPKELENGISFEPHARRLKDRRGPKTDDGSLISEVGEGMEKLGNLKIKTEDGRCD